MNVKNLVLGVGIFIVFMFLLHNGIRAFYVEPEYKSYCNLTQSYESYPKFYPTEGNNCTYLISVRESEQACYSEEGNPVYNYSEQGCVLNVIKCDYCNKYYNEAVQEYNRNVFVIALIVGIIVLFLGFAKLSTEPVGSALMASGIGAIMYGTIGNWGNLGNLGRFLLLLLALALLIWIALKINRKK